MTVLCWDFDGTLAYSDHLWSSCVHRALLETQPDCGVSFSQIRTCMASGFPWHTPEQDFTPYTGEKWWDFMNAHFERSYLSLGIDHEQAAIAAGKVRSLIKQPENYSLWPDSLDALTRARDAGCINILLSNNYPDLPEVMDALGLTPHFSHCVISGVVGYDKPRPEIFRQAKALIPGDHRFLMIGDNPVADIQGGNAAGMTTILVHKGQDHRADYCFENLKDILNIL